MDLETQGSVLLPVASVHAPRWFVVEGRFHALFARGRGVHRAVAAEPADRPAPGIATTRGRQPERRP